MKSKIEKKIKIIHLRISFYSLCLFSRHYIIIIISDEKNKMNKKTSISSLKVHLIGKKCFFLFNINWTCHIFCVPSYIIGRPSPFLFSASLITFWFSYYKKNSLGEGQVAINSSNQDADSDWLLQLHRHKKNTMFVSNNPYRLYYSDDDWKLNLHFLMKHSSGKIKL